MVARNLLSYSLINSIPMDPFPIKGIVAITIGVVKRLRGDLLTGVKLQ
jgi:hypothetical protein